MMSPSTAPPSPDLKLEILRVVIEIAALLRDGGPALTAALAELDERSRSVHERESSVSEREARIRTALVGL
jgi:hypothetical protein